MEVQREGRKDWKGWRGSPDGGGLNGRIEGKGCESGGWRGGMRVGKGWKGGRDLVLPSNTGYLCS